MIDYNYLKRMNTLSSTDREVNLEVIASIRHQIFLKKDIYDDIGVLLDHINELLREAYKKSLYGTDDMKEKHKLYKHQYKKQQSFAWEG